MRLQPRYAVSVAILAGLLLPSFALACAWDYDTIKMERSRFPGTLELITGKFLRHSPEFYQWRIGNRLKRLESDPTNAALLDDLAVAYDKTGKHDNAIETAMKTEKLHPGRYETAANLGTFYFHAGRLEEGLPHIDRALKINPDAHFGREKYQKHVAEYVIRQRKGGPLKLPMAEVKVYPDHSVTVNNSFINFILPTNHGGPLGQDEAFAAVKGILGMMKFGKHDTPVLLEALGTLLTQDSADPTVDAKLLAARAYLKASYEVSEGPGRVAYRGMAGQALQMQTSRRDHEGRISLEQVEQDFQKELAEAREWYAELRERELSWIRDGKDPEAEFDKLYDADPEVSGMNVKDPMSPTERLRLVLIVGGILFIITFVGGLIGVVRVLRHVSRYRQAKTLASQDQTDSPQPSQQA